MGTIAQKLTYLNDTKQLLKENINNLGGNLTNEPFRQYASVLEGIYERLPKVSGIGASLSLSPSLMGKIKLNEIQGNTLQNGTPTPSSPIPIECVTGNQNVTICGKNLLNYDNNTNLVKFYIDASGNKVMGGVDAYINEKIGVTPSGTYYLSFSTRTGGYVRICEYQSNGTFIRRQLIDTNTSFTVSNNCTYIFANIDKTDSQYFTNLMIEKNNQSTTYEPYNGNTYEVNLGKNLLPNNATSQTISNVQYTINEDKSIKVNGTANAVSDLYLVGDASTYVDLGLETGIYNLSGCSNGSLATYMLYAVQNRNGTLTYLQSISSSGLNISVQKGDTFRIFIRVSNGVNVNATIYPQLEKGTQATSYSPYFTPIELNKIGTYEDSIKKSTGKNLFNLYDKTTTNYNGVDVTIENGELTLNGTTTSGTSILGIGIFNHITDITYTCSFVYESGSCTDYGGGIFFSDTSTGTTNVGGGGGFRANQGRSFTLNDIGTKTYYAYMVLNNGTTYTNYKIRFQIEQNNQATTYEPYGKVWYITKNIGKVVLNGTESWETQWNGDNIHGWRTTIPNLKQTTGGSQSSYVISDYYETRTQDENFSTGNYGISNRTNQSQIIIKNNDILNQNDFKTWLGTHNVKIKYQLATPTYTTITNTELIEDLESLYNAKSKDGTTNINVTSEDLSMILNVSVIKGE